MNKHFPFLGILLLWLIFYPHCGGPDSSPKTSTPPEPEFPRFEIFTNSSDPLLIRLTEEDRTVVEFFGKKNEDGIPSEMNYIVVKNPEAETSVIHFNDEKKISCIYAHDGTIFDFNWVSDTKIRVHARSPDGELEVSFVTDLEEATEGSFYLNTKYSAREKKNLEYPGYRPPSAAFTDDSISEHILKDSNENVVVTVKKCNEPWDHAVVVLDISEEQGEFNGYGVPQGNGQYGFIVPVYKTEVADESKACEAASELFWDSCPDIGVLLAARVMVCLLLGEAIDNMQGGHYGAGAEFAGRCIDYFANLAILESMCGDRSRLNCNEIIPVPNRVSETYIEITPIVLADGKKIIGTPKTFSSSGPYENFSVDIPEELDITKFGTNPADPAPEQDYIASAEIICPSSSGTQVTLSIYGTDGYSDSSLVILSEKQTVSLYVPGAEEGVVDTLAITTEDATTGEEGPSKSIIIVF